MIKALPKILFVGEMICLLVIVAALMFKLMHWAGADAGLMVSLLTLASVYFLSAFTMVDSKPSDKPMGILDLLPTIVGKVLFIGLAAYCVGFLFGILRLVGADQQLLVGLLSLALGTLLAMALALQDRNRMPVVKAPLIRAIIALFFHLIWPTLAAA